MLAIGVMPTLVVNESSECFCEGLDDDILGCPMSETLC